ncbi:unnamed protein product [Urochloa humidicola]
MAWKEQVSICDLGPISFSNGCYKMGVCNLFSEMPESEWRSPSRVLEVTIHRAYYPITEKVLHLVFDPFGEVEHVHVLGGSDQLLAQVVFQSKHEAAEAYGELHDRNIYDGCYQMEISWGRRDTTKSLPVQVVPEMPPAVLAPTASTSTKVPTTSYEPATTVSSSDTTVVNTGSEH